jgi:hypothetical protein
MLCGSFQEAWDLDLMSLQQWQPMRHLGLLEGRWLNQYRAILL